MVRESDQHTLYCRLDSVNAVQDYGDAPCIRLIGVEPSDFNVNRFEEGITAFVLDIPTPYDHHAEWRYMSYPMHRFWLFCTALNNFDDSPFCEPFFTMWYEVTYLDDPHGISHHYRCFEAIDYQKITVTSIVPIRGIPLPSFPTFSPDAIATSTTDWCFSAFEVGQGMASMAYSDDTAILFDAGVGTPIKKKTYLAGNLSSNQLKDIVLKRTEVACILSHGDSDHWRMLGWDAGLTKAINIFVVPEPMRSIAFFDVKVKNKVKKCAQNCLGISLGTNTTLDIYRTSPRSPTSNNDGLVAVFTKDDQPALIAGDCVYRQLLKDQDHLVKALAKGKYSALVVPHHGDAESALDVPHPRTLNNGGTPTAFFSAGNHASYKHPHPDSVTNHADPHHPYKTHVNKTPGGIVEINLIP